MIEMLIVSCKELKRRKKNIFTLGIGISISLFMVIFVSLFAASYIKSYVENRKNEYGAFSVLTGDIEDSNVFSTIYNDEKWLEKGVLYLMGIAPSEQGNRDFHLGYMDEGALSLARIKLLEGRYPEKPGEIAVEEGTARRKGLSGAWKVGDTITFDVSTEEETEMKTYVITGIVCNSSSRLYGLYSDSIIERCSFYPIDCFLSYEEVKERVMARNLMLYADCFDKEVLFSNMEDIQSFGNYYTYPQIYNDKDYVSIQVERLLPIVLLALSGISFMFIVFMVSASIEKRRRQLALFRSIGATKTQAFYYTIMEGVLISITFSILGYLVAVPLSSWTIQLLDKPFMYLTKYELYYDYKPWIPIVAMLGTMLISMIAYIIPALTVLKIPPIQEVARSGITKRKRSSKKRKVDSKDGLIQNSIQQTMRRKMLYVFCFILCLTLIHAISVYNQYALNEEFENQFYDFFVGNKKSGMAWNGDNTEYVVDDLDYDNVNDEMDRQMVNELREDYNYTIRAITPLFLTVYPKEKYSDYINYSNGEFYEFGEMPEDPDYKMDMFQFASIYDDKAIMTLKDKVMEGKINLDAMKNGDEIILCMPPYSAITNEEGHPIRIFYDYYVKKVPFTDVRAENNTFHAGDVIGFRYRKNMGTEPVIKYVTIGAIVDAEQGFSPIFADGELEKLGMPYHWFGTVLYVKEDTDVVGLEAKLNAYTDSYEVDVYSNLEASSISRRNRVMINFLGAILIVLFIVVSIGLFLQSTYVRFQNSRKEMAMLRAIGMTRNQAIQVLLKESFILSIIIVIAYVIVNVVWTRMVFEYEWYIYFSIPMNIGMILGVVGILLLTTYVGARAFMKEEDLISTIQG